MKQTTIAFLLCAVWFATGTQSGGQDPPQSAGKVSASSASQSIDPKLDSDSETVDGVPTEILPDPARSWQISNLFNDLDLKEKYLTCIDSDLEGNIWVAVSDGLYFYDGYRWKKYGVESGLPSNNVRSVLVSRDGTLWVGTSKGAGRFRKGSFEGLNAPLAGPSVRRIVEDRQGAIWFCCDKWPSSQVSGGLTRLFGGEAKSWTMKDGLPSDYVSDFFEDSKGRKFVLTNVGLAEFDGNKFKLPLVDAGVWQADTYVWSMVESKIHGLLVSTSSNFYQFKNGSWRRIPMLQQKHGAPKLISTQDGEIFSMNNGHRGRFLQFDGDQWNLIGQSILDIHGGTQMLHEDRSGAIWIVGFQRLLRWDRRNPRWQSFRSIGPPVAIDRQNGLWFSSENKGLLRLKEGQWHRFDIPRPRVFEDWRGKVWIQSSKHLFHIKSENQLSRVAIPNVPNLRFLRVDRENALWMYSRINKSSRRLFAFKNGHWHESSLECGPSEKIVPVCLDPLAGVWVVVTGLDAVPSRLVHLRTDGQREVKWPPEARITSVPQTLVLSNDRILLGDFFGLFETNNGGENWKQIKTPAGFASRLIQFQDKIWVVLRGHVGGEASIGMLTDHGFKSISNYSGDHVRTSPKSTQIFFEDYGRILRLNPDTPKLPTPPLLTPFLAKPDSIYSIDSDTYWVGSSSAAYKYTTPKSPIRPLIGSYPKSIQKDENFFLHIGIRQRYLPLSQEGSYFVSSRVGDAPWSEFELLEHGVSFSGLTEGKNDINLRFMENSGKVTEFAKTISVRVLPVPIQLRPWFRPLLFGILGVIIVTSLVAIVNWRRASSLAADLKREVVRKTGSLSESEVKYQLLFQESQDAILLVDELGRITRFNESAEHLFGPQAKNRPLIDLVARDADHRLIANVLATGNEFENCNLDMLDEDGRTITTLTSIKQMQSLGESHASFQVIVRDTSEMMKLQNRIAESEKLQALGRLAGGIAHDFNNFLAIILFGADLIEVHANGDPRIDQGLQSIVGGVKRGKALVAQIQSYNRAASQHPGSIDVGDLLRKFPMIAEKLLPEKTSLVMEDSPTEVRISVEENLLEQVLINLTVNASHAMPDGGEIRISAGRVAGDHIPELLELDSDRSYVLLKVEDEGCGMDASLKAKIFDPFFTTKPAGQGTGLGLAIVYGIVKQSGGAIEVQSTRNQGTQFQIYFPESQQQIDANQVDSPPQNINRSARILVVDDEPQLRRLIAMSLKNFGYEVSVTDSGEKALQILAADHEFDLVVTDIIMEGMNGLELAKNLEREFPRVSTLLISGYPQTESNDDSLQHVNTPILMKPFRPAELVEKVEEVLGAVANTSER